MISLSFKFKQIRILILQPHDKHLPSCDQGIRTQDAVSHKTTGLQINSISISCVTNSKEVLSIPHKIFFGIQFRFKDHMFRNIIQHIQLRDKSTLK